VALVTEHCQAPSGARFQIRTVLSPLQEARTGPEPGPGAGFQASAHTRSAWPVRRWASRSSAPTSMARPPATSGASRVSGIGRVELRTTAYGHSEEQGAERGEEGQVRSNLQ
jgi:hypothetical protein